MMLFLDALPPELMVRCFVPLDARNLARVELSCTIMRRLPLLPLWKRRCKEILSQTIQPPYGNPRFKLNVPEEVNKDWNDLGNVIEFACLLGVPCSRGSPSSPPFFR